MNGKQIQSGEESLEDGASAQLKNLLVIKKPGSHVDTPANHPFDFKTYDNRQRTSYHTSFRLV